MTKDRGSELELDHGKSVKFPQGEWIVVYLAKKECAASIESVTYDIVICKVIKSDSNNESFCCDFCVDNLNDLIKATISFENGRTIKLSTDLKDKAQSKLNDLAENKKGTEEVTRTEDINEPLKEVKRNKVFVSYSHKDKEWLERIQPHLKVLESEGITFNLWDDTQIKAGMKWREEITKGLSTAKVAILLVSTEFLASDFIRTNELPPLLKAAEEDGATILPLVLKPCRFNKHPKLSIFQAVNDPAKPLSKLKENEQDEILVKLADRIAELMNE